ncbi:MAG: M48 family metallopeptidase [Giesbergeria sp.]|nr:M48 family metallopeptidase [Giesbergeria sp.]
MLPMLPMLPVPAASAVGTGAAAAATVQEFRHPQACRELLLAVQGPDSPETLHAPPVPVLVAFALERTPRRSIGFTVSAAGLVVRAPTRLALSAVDSAVRSKAGWIVRKLNDTRTRAMRQAQAGPVWQDGAMLPYLGTVLRVRLDPAAPAGGVLQPPADGGPGWELRICLPARRTPGAPETPEAAGTAGAPQAPGGVPAELQAAALRRAVHAWMLRQARAHFSARLDHFAPLLGVQWQRLGLTSARTRWGSARADGSIRLNWRLLHCAPEVLDCVVVHELAHLRVMDHSPRFWAVVASVLPDHAALRRRLRDTAVPNWEV